VLVGRERMLIYIWIHWLYCDSKYWKQSW